jgi:hypothetical protein
MSAYTEAGEQHGGTGMKPLLFSLVPGDAAIMRGIITLLENGPANTHELAVHLCEGTITAGRCCKALLQAGIIDHQSIPKDVLGVVQLVPQLAWQLTAAYQRGEIAFNAEKLAGGAK